MGVRGKLQCFCLSLVSPEDTDSAVSSEWSAMTSCGHVWHTKCIQKWWKELPREGPRCPIRCCDKRISIKRPETGKRVSYPIVRLFFEDDVTSDGLESQMDPPSQLAARRVEAGPSGLNAVQRGRKLFGLNEESRARPVRREGENDADEDFIDEDELDDCIIRPDELDKEVTRLRNELRQTQQSVRELRPLRERVDCQAQRILELEEENLDKDGRMIELEEEINELREGAAEADLSRVRGPSGDRERIHELEGEVEGLIDEIEEKQAEKEELESSLFNADFLLEEAQAKVRERETELHEAKIKWKEEERRLKDALALRGEEGEKMVKELQAEVDTHEGKIFDMRLAQDRIQFDADELVKETNLKTTKKLERAEEKVVQALRAQRNAQESVLKLKDQVHRLELALRSWEIKYEKTKFKYEDLKRRRPAAAISDDEEDNEASSKRIKTTETPRKAGAIRMSESPDARMPFRIKNTASAASLNVGPSPVKKQRATAEVLDLRSDEDEMLGAPMYDNDDLYAMASPRRSNNAVASPRASGSTPMPTMTASATTNASSYASTIEKKQSLSKLKSDKYLPDFAKGTKELGPKSRKKL